MADTPKKPEDEAVELLLRLADVLHAAGRDRFRKGIVARGMRVAFSARPVPKPVVPDLPEKLVNERRATQRVYAFLKKARGAGGGDALALWPTEIMSRIKAESPDDELAIRTIHNALKRLNELDLAYSDPARGWVLGQRQPTLPFFRRQSRALPERTEGE